MNTGKRLLVILVLCLASARLPAILMRPLSLEELSQKANLIVEGTALSKICQRDTEGRIYTKIEVQVAEVWKGTLPSHSPANVLVVIQGGGTVGNVRTEVSGEAEYAVGEDVVAFLRFNPNGEPITIGLAQGKFHVWQDKRTGEKFAHNLFHGTSEPPRAATPGSPAGSAPESNPAPLSLKELKRTVQTNSP